MVYYGLYLKNNLKEEQDYILVSDQCWQYLFDIYGGVDLRRFSIKVPKEDGGCDYIIEVHLRKFIIYGLPHVKFNSMFNSPKIIQTNRFESIP